MENHKTYLYKRIIEAKLFIDENYTNSISVGAIAAEACFSEFHFLRLFKQIYQVTPHKYVTRLRVRKAKELLQNGTSITDTCTLVGFGSMSSFIKLFKRNVKLTPSAYSLLAKERILHIQISPLAHIPKCFVEYMHWDK